MDPIIVVTPCSRPQNLYILAQSFFTCPKELDIRWYIYFDTTKVDVDKEANSINSFLDQLQLNLPHLKVTTRSVTYPKKTLGGYGQRNLAIDWIQQNVGGAYIYALDDDNILYPDLLSTIQFYSEKYKNLYKGFIFSQIYDAEPTNESHKWKYLIRIADKEFVKPCYIDIAQYLVHTDLIGDIRIEADNSNGDGKFIQEIYEKNPNSFLFLIQPLCYYNSLNPKKQWVQFRR